MTFTLNRALMTSALVGLLSVTGFIGVRAINGNAASEVVRVAAAGDIACEPDKEDSARRAQTSNRCAADAVSDAILRWSPHVVLPLGDLQYEKASLADFHGSYDRTWGRLKQVTRPVVGNHEYLTPDAAGYFDYFGPAAGERDKGYYSFQAGSWHVVVLNSNCRWVGGCDTTSPQVMWLQQDLRSNRARCTLVATHHPRFSSGMHGDEHRYSPVWAVLEAADVEIVLAGHDHHYERFTPQDAEGHPDPRGPRAFVVGTGGANHTEIKAAGPNSEMRDDDVFGFLGLELGEGYYRWRFYAVDTHQFTDEGEGKCL